MEQPGYTPFVIEAQDYVPNIKSTVTPPDIDTEHYRVYMLSQQSTDVSKAEMVSAR